MSLRFLCGFLDAGQALPEFLRDGGRCRAFYRRDAEALGDEEDPWESLCGRMRQGADGAEILANSATLESDWQADFFLLRLGLAPVPPWVWTIPIPIVAIVEDLDCLWHHHRMCLPRCALAIVDQRDAKVVGCRLSVVSGPLFVATDNGPLTTNNRQRTTDILFVGLPHRHLEREALARLRLWARLDPRYRVVCSRARGEELRREVTQARVVVVRRRQRDRGWIEECARRVGAAVVVEEETSPAAVERLLELGGDALGGAKEVSLEEAWGEVLGVIESEFENASGQTSSTKSWLSVPLGSRDLLARTRHLLAAGPAGDAGLVGDLTRRLAREPDDAGLYVALGLTTVAYGRRQGEVSAGALGAALEEFRRALAVEPGNVMGRLNLVEALVLLKRNEAAGLEARVALGCLDGARDEDFLREDGGHLYVGEGSGVAGKLEACPTGEFAIAWERAGMHNAGRPKAEAAAKKGLVRWRLHQLLSDLTGATSHYFEAALANPESPSTRAALGSALARAGKVDAAISHLQAAVQANPLDLEAARNLYHALGQATDPGVGQAFEPDGDLVVRGKQATEPKSGQPSSGVSGRLESLPYGSSRLGNRLRGEGRRLARDMWLLAKMLPTLPKEEWFANAPPAGDELTSIVIYGAVDGEPARGCVESVMRYTRTPFEIILVDNALPADGADPFAQFKEDMASHPYLRRFDVIRNEFGFAATVSQGLAQAKGYYLVVLDGGSVVTQSWLERMIACSFAEWPRVGMVGPVTNDFRLKNADLRFSETQAGVDSQIIRPDYADRQGLPGFVRRRLAQFQGQALAVERLGDFCLLLRREVYEQVGAGVFDCAEWCSRARAAGFEVLVALDVYVEETGARRQETGESGKETVDRSQESGEKAENTLLTSDSPLLSPPPPSISLCMIVKNEEANLPECLASVAGLTDEIVIVDTGSTDRTREIAHEAGAKVFEFPWVDSFAAARNESIRHATGEWIFWMDADDRLDEENREKLKRLFASLSGKKETGDRRQEAGEKKETGISPVSCLLTPVSCFVMKCLCLPDQETGTATVVDHVRLFRNDPRIRWKYRIHEQILSAVKMAGGEARWSDVVIHHVGYQDRARLGPKLERDVRLLRMDLADDPEEPFTLFNLGWTLVKQGRPGEAMPHLEKSLARSQPGDSVVRKIYALLVECHIRLGNTERALEVCRQGRRVCPDDAEILFEEGALHLEQGNLAAAEASFVALLERRAGAYFASVDPALYGHKSRHSLGSVYLRQGRLIQAEQQWQRALAERPEYTPTLLALGELYLEQGQWTKLDDMIAGLERVPGGKVESAILRAKGHMARKEFGPAKDLLEDAKQRFPTSLLPRVVLAHALLQEDRDVVGAEHALREVLAMDPHHGPTQHNLRVLMNRRGPKNEECRMKNAE